MSPTAALIYVDNIRDASSSTTPATPKRIGRTRAVPERDRGCVAPIRAALQAIPEERRWLVSSEGAFSYLPRDFGLKELYLWPINADQQGTPQQVRKVIDAVRANKIPAVFSESTISPEACPAGRPRDGREIRRCPLRRLAQRGGRPGPDLHRPPAGSRPRRSCKGLAE
jgi:manganese/iron transport system substrate-binding protein